MLYGNREKLLEIVRNNPNLLKSISEDFNSDSDFLMAMDVFDSKFTGEEESQLFTDDLGEIVDLIVEDYKYVTDNIKQMKRLQLDTISIISSLDGVDFDEDDVKKIFDKLENNIEQMRKLRTMNNGVVSKNLSSVVIDSELAMEYYKKELSKNGCANSFEEKEVPSSLDTKVDKDALEPVFNVNPEAGIEVSTNSTPEQGLVSNVNVDSDVESSLEVSEQTPILGLNSSPESEVSLEPAIDTLPQKTISGVDADSNAETTLGMSGQASVLDLNSSSVPEASLDSAIEALPVVSEQVPNVFEESLSNDKVKLNNNQYILGRGANGNYYLVIDSNMTPEALQNVRTQISELKPELDSSQLIVDYGNVLLDSNLEVLLNGYAKDENN